MAGGQTLPGWDVRGVDLHRLPKGAHRLAEAGFQHTQPTFAKLEATQVGQAPGIVPEFVDHLLQS